MDAERGRVEAMRERKEQGLTKFPEDSTVLRRLSSLLDTRLTERDTRLTSETRGRAA